ncbi:MAG: putative toxin-antitoxin system toxin component, PIN family [Patescibacteria group bacterium]
MGEKPIVVLDTNVIVSALLWKGAPRAIFDLAEQGTISIATSKSIIDELTKVLDYPRLHDAIARHGLVKNQIIERFVDLVDKIEEEDYPIGVIQEDPDDDKVLSCAAATLANYIVSGDQHVLKLKSFMYTQILSPADFLARING